MHSTHAHIHFAWPNAEEEFPRNRIEAIDAVQNGRLGIESKIAADSQRHFIAVPNISDAAKSVGADAETRMIIAQTNA